MDDEQMITVTDKAVKQLQDLLGDEASDSSGGERGLRLFIERGGCAGLQYSMKIDARGPDDIVVERDGVRLFVAPDSADLLQNSEVDYSDDLTDAGFKINNPNAARSCGCGTSFEAAAEDDEPAYESSLDGSVCGDDGIK